MNIYRDSPIIALGRQKHKNLSLRFSIHIKMLGVVAQV